MQRLLHWLTSVLLVSILAACGGGGGDSSPPTASAPASIATRVEAGPAAVLLTSLGASRALSARLLDAAGAPVTGAISWSSSDPAAVAVDASGTVRALVGAGSARITASSGALPSVTVLVTIAQPVAGAQLLTDSQIVSGPTPVDANVESAADNPYEVVLRGAPALSIGSILIASEAANVAGRVVAVQPEGSDQRVRLVVVPPAQLFTAFDFRDSVDLAQGPFEIPADLAAVYDVVQTGSTFVFTPKPGANITGSSGREQRTSLGLPARPMPPFKECESSIAFASGQPSPVGLSAAPAFEVTVDGTARREANSQGSKFIVTGNPKFKVTSVLEVKAAFEAKLGCKLTFVTSKFRAPGWAGAFFGGDVEYGLGFELGGKFTLANAKVGGTAALNTTLEATLDCRAAAASCTLGGNAGAQTELKPEWQAPNLNQAQFEPSVNLFGFVSLEAGNADIQQLQFKAIEIKAGAELAASLAPEAVQIDNLDPGSGRSKYALAFKGDVGPGVKLGGFLRYLGLAEVVPLKLAFEVPLGTSPTAASASADRARYLPGEAAVVTVRLDAASTLFPAGLVYNVERVVLQRKSGLVSTELLAQQVASSGQTEFTFNFTSPGLMDAAEIFAFVVTKALPMDLLALELAAATAGSPPVQVKPNGLTIERSSDIQVREPDGSFTNSAPFDDRVRIPDDESAPPFVGSLSSTVGMPAGLSMGGSLTLTAASEIDAVSIDPQSGAVSVTMKGRAACNTALRNDPDSPRQVDGVDLFSRYDADKGVVIGPGGATVVISAHVAVSPLLGFGSRGASARVGILNGSTFEEVEIRDTNGQLTPVFNRTVVMPVGGAVDVGLDARVACLVAGGGPDQSHAAEATFTINVTPN